MPRIFAKGVFGSDYDLWAAWSFTDAKTRNDLASIISEEDWCLAIGMKSDHTPDHEQGRLISLVKIGPELIDTRELVEPNHWRRNVRDFGEARWRHAFPIRAVERFVPGPNGLPLKDAILPRIREKNLHMKVGRYFLELEPDEVARILALPRTPDTNIYQTTLSSFAAHLAKPRKGPRPTPGTRTLSIVSGRAATYLMKLEGSESAKVIAPIAGGEKAVWKVGFSKDPERRRATLNAFLPCEQTLNWKIIITQWHLDEINAWAMEQRLFELLEEAKVNRFKGEMVVAEPNIWVPLWAEAKRTARRPTEPVEVEILDW